METIKSAANTSILKVCGEMPFFFGVGVMDDLPYEKIKDHEVISWSSFNIFYLD